MIRFSNLQDCIVRPFTGHSPVRALNRGIIIGLSLLLLFSLFSCAATSSTTYEAQRRGLLMLEGEHIYKNKGFYHSKESQKRRKQAMRAHKKNLRH